MALHGNRTDRRTFGKDVHAKFTAGEEVAYCFHGGALAGLGGTGELHYERPRCVLQERSKLVGSGLKRGNRFLVSV